MLQHGRDSSLSSIANSFNDTCSISSGSPRTPPLNSPYVSPGGSPRDSLNQQFANSMSLQPPLTNTSSKNSNNTFVHKLYNMVVDHQYQYLIAWNYTGSSFIVCNIMEFSKDVLPKHFKHNNFSSFVRQLNMYGFHKVNKSPRGHRTLAENQIWEFSHPKFIKDRPDILDEIKRKSLETENTTKRDHGDINSHMAMMQASQSEMMQQLARLQDNFNQVVRELAETKSRQTKQYQMLKSMMEFISSRQQQESQLQVPPELNMGFDLQHEERPPSIFITSHDTNTLQNTYFNRNTNTPSPSSSRAPVLTVQTHNLSPQLGLPSNSPLDQQNSPALSAYHTALNTPVSPSPSPFISDDDIPSLYSPHSPLTPNTFTLNDGYYNAQQQQQQQQQQPYISPPLQQQQQDINMMDQHSLGGGVTYNSFALGAQRNG
ncbi:hypothetical protein [Parasitella parasitica]|uniref:HSF-type DNA-binding domain-containing protein n=1 Tax=Parasitella parasitica TaxID=35722 RepID=A0A0B7NRG0_9FUNG|nr:hypothetical protein [Parasitella parasitica]